MTDPRGEEELKKRAKQIKEAMAELMRRGYTEQEAHAAILRHWKIQ